MRTRRKLEEGSRRKLEKNENQTQIRRRMRTRRIRKSRRKLEKNENQTQIRKE
ncbi:hypothetical protein F511_09635 [Dorcoceras hygrometricum]|uniref:Uncharacterized protein n=1 Tax=Dorcoceras hygrometricum TaxID=472368 RepID=A0A2Z7DDQ3_9LAMI|nr:hypothetical protein F511_09635 [Dorcoceras hygrometricum]